MQARYTITRKIADGGTAEIFLAVQRGAHGFERPVVLKRIFPALYADPQFRNMLVDEAHIAMSLNHSNIVQVLDLGEAEGQYVLAMDLVDGWTLDAVLRRARALNTAIPPALALYISAEVCRALAYAHAKTDAEGRPLGIVHRDISPHNVLLSEQGEVKLTDFGIAKARNRRESSLGNIIKGKIAYMSPEQASGGELDARSDLFSVGTMLYVMICRRYPFDAATDLEVLLLVKEGQFVPPEKARPGLNPEVYRVLHRAMSKDPGARYQQAHDMLLDFEQVMRVGFRAVGQTELKRWLKDLSMRDGVEPLTRAAPPVAKAPSRLEGEEFELRGVGTTSPPTLPPPSGGTGQHQPPAPANLRPPGRARPRPPAAAMAIGRRPAGGPPPPPPRGALGTGHRAGVGSGPIASRGSVVAPPPDPIDDDAELTEVDANEMLAEDASGHDQHDIAHDDDRTPAPEDQLGAIAEGVRSETAGAAGADAADHPGEKTPPAEVLEAVPVAMPAPRKSSSWVAEAVAAAAQRAGTTPAPPVAPAVPPPPVAFPLNTAPAAQAPEPPPPEPVSPPRRPRLLWASGIAATALVVLVVAIRACGGDGEPTAASTKPSRPTASEAPPPAPAPPRPVAAAPEVEKPPAVAPAATPAVDGPPPAPPAPTAAPAGAAATATAPPAAGGSTVAAPPAPSVVAPPQAPAEAPAAPVAAAAERPTPAAEARVPDGGAPEPQIVPVLVKSIPAGATVGTPHHTFGDTPITVRLRAGKTYAFSFSREGYKSLTKSVRVTDEADQEIAVTLKKAAAPPPKPAPPEPKAAPPPPPPSPKPAEKTWFQRMFGRQ